MKKGLKIVIGVLLIPYLIVAIFLTVCLLNYNDYNVTVFNNKSLIIIRDSSLEPTYKKNDLVVIEKKNISDLKNGDEIFFYRKNKGNQIEVNLAKVEEVKPITDDEGTIVVEGDHPIINKFYIGASADSKIYSGIGGVLATLESRWGYLFIIVLPILLIFLYEIYAFILEIKKPLKDE